MAEGGSIGRICMDWSITDCRRSWMVTPVIMLCCAQYAHILEKSVSVNVYGSAVGAMTTILCRCSGSKHRIKSELSAMSCVSCVERNCEELIPMASISALLEGSMLWPAKLWVPALPTSREVPCVYVRKRSSPIGDRQILPVQMNRTRMFLNPSTIEMRK